MSKLYHNYDKSKNGIKPVAQHRHIYEPSKIILENLYKRAVKNGLIVLDDYSIVPGATRAIDEFFIGTLVEKLSISNVPSFIIK